MTPRPRGRPRSEAVDAALREATIEEFVERGLLQMSMESIAARAGASKVSLYRRWRSRLEVCADVLVWIGAAMVATEDRGSLEADLRLLLEETLSSEDARRAAGIVMRTMGEISADPQLRSLYRERLLEPRLEQIRNLLERARSRGELRQDLPTDVAVMIVAGPLFVHALSLLTDLAGELPEDLVESLLSAMLAGIGGGEPAQYR